uniref:Uncharacterized protein n=1 Tax=Candidatus Kentrum sp. MB TaxID=2138164 RepID=A0A450XI45_9GAMM|nr:MAG: hypothetical protein BECKMB1821G_GA0114241_10431 [Candidatus Kentron sp. MB]VFK33395.1 MAG: hypothetical protein BECKMB1821I_GA0114274_10451 [Candidatus Kentron sp. MB]VFK76144.1 MAG: hypothetical protein BECKMB1821H_GA0114242_10441 [Candidatus Kentron sp. MB]
MNVLQVHYTSCRHGSTGYAGFQVRATSEGIDPSDLQEVVKHCSYRRPLSGQGHEENNDLPVACRFYRLSSGRYALTRACYTGTDYSDREGNFFAHTLVLPDGALERPPMDYFLWAGWKETLEPGEDDAPPAPLPPVAMDDIPGGDDAIDASRFEPEALTKFLQEKGKDRIERLKAMVRAVFLAQTTSRTLVIRTHPSNAMPWIAALYRCFPPSIGITLDFSSYEYSLIGLPLITATVEGTEITCDQMQRDYQFYVFDEQTGSDSAVPDEPEITEYAKLVVNLLIHAPHRLEEMFEFVRGFDCPNPDLSLCRVARIHSLTISDGSTPDPDEVRVLAAFALEYPKAPRWEEIAKALTKPLRNLTTAWQPADHLLFVRFLTTVGQARPSDQYGRDAIVAWREFFLMALAEGDLPTEIEAARRAIMDTTPNSEAAIANELLTQIDRMGELIEKGSVDTAKRILAVVRDALNSLQKKPVLKQSEMIGLVGVMANNWDVLQNLLPELLTEAGNGNKDTDTFIDLCGVVGILDENTPENIHRFGELLAGVFSRIESEFTLNVRHQFPAPIVVAEWEAITWKAGEPVTAFLDYRVTVIDKLEKKFDWRDYGPHLLVPLVEKQIGNHRAMAQLAQALKPSEALELVKIMAGKRSFSDNLLPALLISAGKRKDEDAFLKLCGVVGISGGEITSDNTRRFGELLAGVFSGIEPEFALKVRHRFPDPIVVAEWEAITWKAGDPVTAFLQHHDTIIKRLKKNLDWKDYGPQLVKPLVEKQLGKSKATFKLTRYLAERKEIQKIDTSLATRLLGSINQEIPLDPNKELDSDLKDLLPRLEGQMKGIEPKPNRIQLRNVLSEVGRFGFYPTADLLKMGPHLSALNDSDYGMVVDFFLGTIKPNHFPPKEHPKFIQALHDPKNIVFRKRYLKWLKGILREVKPADLGDFIATWLTRNEGTREGKVMAELDPGVMPILVDAMVHHRDSEDLVRKYFSGLAKSSTAATRLKELDEQVQKKKRGFLGRIKGLFSGSMKRSLHQDKKSNESKNGQSIREAPRQSKGKASKGIATKNIMKQKDKR